MIPLQNAEGGSDITPPPQLGNAPLVVVDRSTNVELLGSCEINKKNGPANPASWGSDLEDWVPPSGRGSPSILYMEARGEQPAWEARPSLSPSQSMTTQDRVHFATILNPIRDIMSEAIPNSPWNFGEELRDIPRTFGEGRLAALKFPPAMSVELNGRNRIWDAQFPYGSPSKSMNFALTKFLFGHLGYEDMSLPGDLSRGMPFAGHVPESGEFKKRARKAGASLPDWRDGLASRGRLMMVRARLSDGAEIAGLCWEKTSREV